MKFASGSFIAVMLGTQSSCSTDPCEHARQRGYAVVGKKLSSDTIEGVDKATFVRFDDVYAKDKNQGYGRYWD